MTIQPVRPALLGRRAALTGAAVLGAGLALGLAPTAQATAARPRLRRGDRGAAVTALQNRLNALGYWIGAADGSFGHLTQQAVYAAQKAAGLGVDGIVGPATWGALDKGIRPTPVTGGKDTAFEIDLARQLLLCVSEGRLAYILNTSTGSGKKYWSGGRWKVATTPKGTFSMFRFHSDGWQSGPLGSMYRPGYYDRGWAIHGSADIPPYPASHGCSRISTAAADMLWARHWFTTGRRVIVR